MKRRADLLEAYLPTKQCRRSPSLELEGPTQQLFPKLIVPENFTQSDSDSDCEMVQEPQVGTQSVSLQEFPLEILLLVFQWLSPYELCTSVSPVCRRWQSAAKHPCLWKSLSFRGKAVATEDVSTLLCRTTQLRNLLLVERTDAAAIIRQVCRSNRKLRSLVIKRCRGTEQRAIITANLLLGLVRACKDLHDLTIKDTQFRSAKFYRILGSSLPRIKKLNFSYNLQFGSTALNNIASNCEPLEELRVFRDFGFRSSLPHCDDKDIQILSSRMRSTLKVLKLNSAELTDVGLEAIAQCVHLHTLHIRFALNVTDNGIIALGKLQNLTTLEVSMARNVTASAWCNLFSQAKWKVKRLGLAVCALVDDQVLDSIGATCQHLERIRMSGCIRITEAGVSNLIRGCSELKYLNVFFTQLNVVQSFPLIPDYLPKLETLVFRPFGLDEELLILRDLKSKLPNLVIEEQDDCKRDGYWRNLHL